jgi:hypothetical protein
MHVSGYRRIAPRHPGQPAQLAGRPARRGEPAPARWRARRRVGPGLMGRFWRVRWCRDHGSRDHARRVILRLSVFSSLTCRRVAPGEFWLGTGHAPPGASRRNLRRPAFVLIKAVPCFCSCQDSQALGAAERTYEQSKEWLSRSRAGGAADGRRRYYPYPCNGPLKALYPCWSAGHCG